MTGKRIARYGAWPSPVTSDLVASSTIGLGQIALDGENIYWLEQRPTEAGRNVLVRRGPDGDVVAVMKNKRAAYLHHEVKQHHLPMTNWAWICLLLLLHIGCALHGFVYHEV